MKTRAGRERSVVRGVEARAPASGARPRPFLKWAGGKTQLLPELLVRIPRSWDRERDAYYEPFMGGAALFWALLPRRAHLGDACDELVGTYAAVRDHWSDMVRDCLVEIEREYRVDPEATYYRVRERDVSPAPGWRAARAIFLNKAGFNGLYRVNKAGKFNVPWGKNPRASIVDEANLDACSKILRGEDVVLSSADFEVVAGGAPAGSLAYFDPPYFPSSRTSNFTSYTVDGFCYHDHLRLLLLASSLRDRGVHVLVTEAADEKLIDQYRRCGFQCDLVRARRSVSSRGDGRGAVGEYVVY